MKAMHIRNYRFFILRFFILILVCMLLFIACTPAYIEQEEPGPATPPSQEDNIMDNSIEDTTGDKDKIEEDNTIERENTIDESNTTEEDEISQIDVEQNPVTTIDEYITYFEAKYAEEFPNSWGERVNGVITEINTEDKVAALTFDACGGKSDGYDAEIIEFLIREGISATLFINSHWIDKFPNEFYELAANPLFEIANHGYKHKPLSVTGESAYGITGTKNIREVIEEILLNDEKIFHITGYKPRYFRSGTAYYDEVAVKIANELGYKVVNYNVLGDAGASFSKEQIVQACSSASPGSIILFHMNRPEKNIAEGIIEGIKLLKDNGYTFVKLSDYHDYLR